jgi:hypothetical protein
MAAGVLRPSACQAEAGFLDPQSLVNLVLGLGSGQAQYLVFHPHCLVVLEHLHLLELEKKKKTN